MDPQHLLDVHASAPLVFFHGDQKRAAERVLAWDEAGLTVRRVRGRKMRTVDALFDEVAAALQFPYYFGENWAAFDECLSDMDWLSVPVGIVVIIFDAVEVLSEEPQTELDALVRTIAQAAKSYAEPISLGEWWDRPAIPFHVVLQASDDEESQVLTRWGEPVAGNPSCHSAAR